MTSADAAATPRTILFVCVHNSARSQMAEAFVNRLCASRFSAMSAGLERGTLNPYVVEVMGEIGYDLSNNTTKGVVELNMQHGPFDVVVTVCDESSGARCPVFPTNGGERLHWTFADPSAFRGSRDAILARTRTVRDEIRARIEQFCAAECR